MLESLTASLGLSLKSASRLSPLLADLQQWAGSNTSATSLSLTLLLATAVVFTWSRRRHPSTPGPLPPSPGIALPLVGHLHLLRGEADPRVMFSQLREKLGDIFSFYAGNRIIVVLNGYDVIREAFVKQADVFSHRAHTFMSEQMGKGKGIVNTSGRHWREQRQFAERALRKLGVGRESALAEKVECEVSHLMTHLDSAANDGSPVNPAPLIMASFANIIISIIYGHRFSLDDPKFCDLMTALKNCFNNFGNTEPLNFFPLVRFLPGDPYCYWFCIKNVKAIEGQLVYPEIEDHRRRLATAESEDVISAYLREMNQKRDDGTPTSMDEENLVKVAGDLLAGGTEPPSTTALWVLLYLVRYPHVQDRCYQELLSQVGKDRSPTLEDKNSLPYLEATIMEVQRQADVGPFAMAHGLSRDTSLRGFRLPRDAIVLANIHSVHHDQEVWGDPHVFRPERFLGEDGRLKRHTHFLPYSLGPRICPGALMASMELFLFISTILNRYRLSHHGPTSPTLEGNLALLHYPPEFSMKLERRQ